MKLFIYLMVMLLIACVGIILISLLSVPSEISMMLGYVWGSALVLFGTSIYDSI